ncbi:MAG: aromatic ring-hydroxylating dioxygenase subunit alpha [Candidatus Sericytochromatia bacterium]|uniref:Aromatic ring-hydroxylating dioxygenase subunit alpha n=1 Tax=Candidatus Tanganyikabacteria bacterium TaxID=2961651 RepID=A0A938BMC9_9BACT|nr:aromatic ring-hydroxylating dioxygenase subunit alpha [Candidatus Tanganyikabacteria bacterium]
MTGTAPTRAAAESRFADELARFDPRIPLDSASTIPSSWYLLPDFADLEREALFARAWQYVGSVHGVANPGDYITADIAGEPILVVRDAEGALRALSNVCRHRGGPLASGAGTGLRALKCGYHGWSYDLSGRLLSAPEFDGVCDFDRQQVCLPPVRVEIFGPFVFANLDPGAPALTDALGTFAAAFRPHGLPFSHRKVHPVACNWKVFVDNYLDGGYHVNHVHPGLGGVIDYAAYRCELHEGWNVQTSPLRPSTRIRDGTLAYASSRGGDAAYYYWLFPNLMINCYEGVIEINHVRPTAIDRCEVVFDYFYAPGLDRAASDQVSDQVQEEDRRICEAVQKGLGSRWYDTGRFSVKRENGGHQFHVMLAAALQAAAPPPSALIT